MDFSLNSQKRRALCQQKSVLTLTLRPASAIADVSSLRWKKSLLEFIDPFRQVIQALFNGVRSCFFLDSLFWYFGNGVKHRVLDPQGRWEAFRKGNLKRDGCCSEESNGLTTALGSTCCGFMSEARLQRNRYYFSASALEAVWVRGEQNLRLRDR